MIDVDTTWQRACNALASDDYDQAFGLLSRAIDQASPPQQAQLALYIASLHSLYGELGSVEMQAALEGAAAFFPGVRQGSLFQALWAEWQARTQGTVSYTGAGLTADADPLTRYHALCALGVAGQAQQVLDVPLRPAELPPHLRWRLRSWQADAQETLGHTEQAETLYAEAAALAQGLNRAFMLQEQAALLLQMGQLQKARSVLAAAHTHYGQQDPDEGLNLATWHYLSAQVLLQMGEAEAAYNDILAAAQLERQHGDPSYGVALVRGQTLAHLGKTEEALVAFEQALQLAGETEQSFVNHELGVVFLDLDRPLEAHEHLAAALTPDYPYQPEVLADMAECEYRMGNMAQAQETAERALNSGAVIAASMVLGNVALEYYHLDDALEHYERVVREAIPESRDWVMGHQMAADVLAQQGFRDPAAIYAHAQQALAHLPESDDWHATLQEHLQKAEGLLGQGLGRTLN